MPEIDEIVTPVKPEDLSKEELFAELDKSRKQGDNLCEILQRKISQNIDMELSLIKWKCIAGFFACMSIAMLIAVIVGGIC